MSLDHQKEIENHHSQKNSEVICPWWWHSKGLRIRCFIFDIEMGPTLGAPYPQRVSIRYATISSSILLSLCQSCCRDLVSIHDSSPRNGEGYCNIQTHSRWSSYTLREYVAIYAIMIYTNYTWYVYDVIKFHSLQCSIYHSDLYNLRKIIHTLTHPPCAAYMCQRIGSVLVSIMAWCLFSAKPSS